MLSDCLTRHSYARSSILPWPYARSIYIKPFLVKLQFGDHTAPRSWLSCPPTTNNNVPRGGATARSTYVSSGTEEEKASQTQGPPTTRAEKQPRQPSEPSVSDRHTVTPSHTATPLFHSSLPVNCCCSVPVRAESQSRMANGLECSKAEGAEWSHRHTATPPTAPPSALLAVKIKTNITAAAPCLSGLPVRPPELPAAHQQRASRGSDCDQSTHVSSGTGEERASQTRVALTCWPMAIIIHFASEHRNGWRSKSPFHFFR